MTRYRTLVVLAVAWFVIAVATASPAHALPAGWGMGQLSSGGDVGAPAISGDRVVWTGVDNLFNIQAFTWRVGDSRVTTLTDTADSKDNAQVSGDRVVWEDTVGGNVQICTLKVVNGPQPAPTFLTSGSFAHSSPQVSGDRVAWSGADGASSAQMLTQVVGGPLIQLTTDGVYHWGPALSGDRVAWTAYENVSGYSQLFTWKLGDALPVGPLTSDSANKSTAQVSGDRVVWRAFSGGAGTIGTCSVGNSPAATIDAVGATNCDSPQVSGDHVVFRGWDGRYWQIYSWTAWIGTAPLSPSTWNEQDHSDPQVSGDRVVWAMNDDTNWQIQTWTEASGAQTLTVDAHDHDKPRVSADRVVWRGFDGIHWNLYTAAPLMTVWRFYRPSTGTHFYTSDPAEMQNVVATLGSIYHLEGVAYTLNTSNMANSQPLWRFYNRRTGTHLYTADPAEKATILATLGSIYSLDGMAYRVSMTTGTPVHRFYSPSKGVHFYSADPAEVAYVQAHLGAIWRYEGPAFDLAP